MICSSALRSGGSPGPSGLDAAAWKRLCTSFHSSSNDLCVALFSLAQRLCTQYVDPVGLYPFVASRLIALDKQPGVRPIGVGEAVRRLVGKAILRVIGPDVVDAAGTSQLCAGQLGGCETAVHAIRDLFSSQDCEAVLLVDASNAFNSLNRQNALRNIHSLCPALAIVATICYQLDVPLFIDGEVIYSVEGTTQGDPLAMVIYAVGLLPIIHHLSANCCSQIWYADDAAACGSLTALREWWSELGLVGPAYGYFSNPSKSWLIVKPDFHDTASSIFSSTNVNITTEGRRYLGSAIGSPAFISSFTREMISEWVSQLELLISVVRSHPHAAYSAFVRGLNSKWTCFFSNHTLC